MPNKVLDEYAHTPENDIKYAAIRSLHTHCVDWNAPCDMCKVKYKCDIRAIRNAIDRNLDVLCNCNKAALVTWAEEYFRRNYDAGIHF